MIPNQGKLRFNRVQNLYMILIDRSVITKRGVGFYLSYYGMPGMLRSSSSPPTIYYDCIENREGNKKLGYMGEQ